MRLGWGSGYLRMRMSMAIGVGLIATLAVVLQALAVRGERDRQHLRRLEHLARAGLAVFEGLTGDESLPIRRDRFRAWSWAVVSDPSVVGVALLDAGGKVLELEPADLGEPAALALEHAGANQSDLSAPGHGIQVLAGDTGLIDLGEGLGLVRVIRADAGSEFRLLVFGAAHEVGGLPAVPWWVFAWFICTAAGLVWAWMGGVFEQSLWSPIRGLVRATAVGGAALKEPLQTEGKGLLAELARNVARMLDDHRRNLSRVGQLERTMDFQVAQRTRQIQAMLTRAERKAWIDPLTRLGNRRLLDDRLEELFATQMQRGEDLSLVVMDLDNFKGLNDALGHAAGDELLIFVGELLRGSLRSSDIGLRLGGDEFLVILLGSGSSDAMETAERLTKLFGQRASLFGVTPKVTMSAGVASARDVQPAGGAELLSLADAALYEAKGKGKGCVQVHKKLRAGSRALKAGWGRPGQ